MQKTNQEEFRIERVIKKKGNKLYAKWKGYDKSFNSWIDKKDLVQMSQYFPKRYETFGGEINVKVDLSNYATKSVLKNVSRMDVSSFALKSNLVNLKTEANKLDIDKLTPIPNDLAKLSNAVKNDVVKKTEYNKLVSKVDNITGFLKKNKYEKDGPHFEKQISDVDKKIPDVSGLVKKSDLNAKVSEIKNKIPSITGLATNSESTTAESKIPDANDLIKKTDYDTKISGIEKKIIGHDHGKYITTPEFNTLEARVFNARLGQADLVTKTDFDVRLQNLNKKINSNKTLHLLVETEFKKIEKFDAAYFRGKNYFHDDGTV